MEHIMELHRNSLLQRFARTIPKWTVTGKTLQKAVWWRFARYSPFLHCNGTNAAKWWTLVLPLAPYEQSYIIPVPYMT